MSLEIIRHIVPDNAMRAKALAQVFDLLQGDAPQEKPQALLVGGCVRNLLLGHPIDDIDIATPHTPDEVIKRLNGAGIKTVPTGIDHGTITAVTDGNYYEITTLRHDRKTDGRHAEVEYTDSWLDDARRRDFTINTLLMDLSGNVYDPTGQGIVDIEQKKVRFVGEASKRIEEDYLRILRFFRFTALYSDDFDREGLAACAALADGIKTLSKERVTQEFLKIMGCDQPSCILNIMFEHKILCDLKFKGYDPAFLDALCLFQKRYNLNALSPRIFSLTGLDEKIITLLDGALLLPKVFIKDIRSISGALNLPDLSCDSAVREAVYRFGRVASAHALLIELVQDRVVNRYAPTALEIIQNWDIPMLPVSGHDLMATGIEKGPELGKALETLENYWIEQDFKPDRDALLYHIVV